MRLYNINHLLMKMDFQALLLSCFIFVSVMVSSSVFAQQDRWWRWWATPVDILDNTAGETSEDLEIQDTELNDVSSVQGSYQRKFRITNTLDSIRQNISPYLQWTVFIWLAIAVILIIYNWLLLVSSSVHKSWELSNVFSRLWNIGIGVALLLWFYFIVKVTIILINAFTQA